MADHKDEGNQFFLEKKYDQALACYSRAIKANPHAATYYTNRALCYIKLRQWTLTVDDCQKAVQIDPTLIKAHFFMGQALTELENYDDAITALTKAHDLAREQHKNFGEDITSAVRQAKKMRWNLIEEKRLKKQSDLQSFLLQLLKDHMDRQLSSLSFASTAEERSAQVERIHAEHAARLVEVNTLFKEVDSSRQKREVPDYLCGKISFELMTDPYITPSGITFDKKDIEEHLQRVGHFDPVTRQPLTQEQLVPNLAMKEVVDSFVAQNGWIEDY